MKILLLLCCLGLGISSGWAAPLSLYKASVPVTDTNAANSKLALNQACIQVMVKASGSKDAAQQAAVQDYCAKSAAVQELSYTRVGDSYLLNVQFDAQAIDKILSATNQQLWHEPRPVLLGLVSVVDVNGMSHLSCTDLPSADTAALTAQFAELGLTLVLPRANDNKLQRDLGTDVLAVPISLLSTDYYSAYQANAALLAKLTLSSAGVLGQCTLFFGNEQWSWEVNGLNVNEVFTKISEHIVQLLKTATVVQDNAALTMVINGITTQRQLHDAVQILQKLGVIKELNILSVDGVQVTLGLTLTASKQQLLQSLQLHDAMRLQGESDNMVVYMWVA